MRHVFGASIFFGTKSRMSDGMARPFTDIRTKNNCYHQWEEVSVSLIPAVKVNKGSLLEAKIDFLRLGLGLVITGGRHTC